MYIASTAPTRSIVDQACAQQTVIPISGENFLLYAAAGPETNSLIRVRLFPRLRHHSSRLFSANYDKIMVSKPPVFSVEDVQHLQVALQ